MKLKIQFAERGVLYDAICDAAQAEFNTSGLDGTDTGRALMRRRHAITSALEPWIKHGGHITIEFDTEAKTATVLPS